MTLRKLHLRAERDPFQHKLQLMAMTKEGHRGLPVVMEKVELGTAYEQPTMTLDLSAAQELMDDLWRAGLRPSEGTGSAGAMAATEKHLRDMRDIAFHQLQIKQGD